MVTAVMANRQLLFSHTQFELHVPVNTRQCTDYILCLLCSGERRYVCIISDIERPDLSIALEVRGIRKVVCWLGFSICMRLCVCLCG